MTLEEFKKEILTEDQLLKYPEEQVIILFKIASNFSNCLIETYKKDRVRLASTIVP